MPNVPDEALKAAKVRTTFSAIRAWETATKQTSIAVNGSTPDLTHHGVTIHVRSPSATPIAAYLAECVKRPAYIKSDANRYSIVLETVFGMSRIVLPGDLPRTVRKKSVSPGWNDLAASAPQLAEHVLLKVPHHGSAEAIHPDIMTAGAPDRAWAITPYSSANRLPNVAASDGLPDILSRGGGAC